MVNMVDVFYILIWNKVRKPFEIILNRGERMREKGGRVNLTKSSLLVHKEISQWIKCIPAVQLIYTNTNVNKNSSIYTPFPTTFKLFVVYFHIFLYCLSQYINVELLFKNFLGFILHIEKINLYILYLQY
jgi:hypothetical protein